MVTREKATEIDIWGVWEKVKKSKEYIVFVFTYISCYFDIYLKLGVSYYGKKIGKFSFPSILGKYL